MRFQTPIVDYRKFSLRKLNTEEFCHLKLLFFWPLFGLLFLYVERFYPVTSYYPVHCALDDMIPFNEFFVIPYLFWFVSLVGMSLYTLLYDIGAFRRYMKFIIITYLTAILVYFIFPTCQNLRPVVFERDNLFTQFISGLYQFDTHTNVCPSIHVIGALAVLFASWYVEKFRSKYWRTVSAITAALICASTVFLKQHSILDVLAALPICLIGYVFCYGKGKSAVG